MTLESQIWLPLKIPKKQPAATTLFKHLVSALPQHVEGRLVVCRKESVWCSAIDLVQTLHRSSSGIPAARRRASRLRHCAGAGSGRIVVDHWVAVTSVDLTVEVS